MAGIDQDRDQTGGPGDWDGDADQPLETGRLALEGEEERLPWLESPDDEDYSDYESGDNTRLLGFVILGLIALGLLVGAIWWVSNSNSEATLVADGSLVPAPTAPYKEAPKDPGGKTFAGTGDSSFAVSDGQTRPAQLGGATPAPIPAATAAPSPKPATGTPTPAATASGVGVQVGAYSNAAAAEAGWSKLVGLSEGTLTGVSHRVIEGKADNGSIFRLQAVAGDAAAAGALCASLKAKGIACQVK